jgi:hypothetical protein
MKLFTLFLLITLAGTSCMRAVSPGEAASGRYKKCHPIR